MSHDIKEYVVHEELIEDHSKDMLRSGEGAICELSDGTLYFIYGKFDGPKDEDKATLIEIRSKDGGLTWTEKKDFLKPSDDILNNMSTSLLNLQDGRIAMIYMHKVSTCLCYPMFITSSDDAETWSEPVKVSTERDGYYVVNNDRLIQLKSGRLLAPYAYHGENPDFTEEGAINYCGCFISDDTGKSWRMSKQEIAIEKEDVIMPKLYDETKLDQHQHILDGWVVCQEPGVVELSDGNVMLWCRTPGGYAYRSYSDDGGETWSPYKPIEEFAMPCGPQSIKMLPGTNRLIMLYNDRKEVPQGHEQFGWRRPLSLAVSDDDGESWKYHGLLESELIPSNCYYSIFFHKENVVFSYYEGVWQVNDKGFISPRNLTSLKLKVVKQEYFKL